jgi:PRTRC genetic system protein C
MAEAREFRWGAQILPDPDITMTPEEVRDYYSAAYPQLTTAAVQIHGETDGTQNVTFAAPAKASAAKPKQTVEFVQNQGKRG